MSQGFPAAALESAWHAMHEARGARLAEGYDALYTSLAPVSNAIQPLSALHWVRDLGVHGAALDVGCGDGRNSLALARLGFSVTAIDLSPVGVAKLQRAAETERLAIRTDVSDVQTFGFVEAYDVIVVAYMLHHLTRDAARQVLRRLKSHTSPGGVHLIAMFNHGGSFEELDPEAGAFYPTGEEIEALYGDWRALQHDHVHEDTLKATRSDSTDYSIFVVQRPDSPPHPRPITAAADALKEDIPWSIDSDHIRHLDQFDLESVSIAEIKRLRNPVLRNVLLEAMAVTAATAVAKEHTSHGMHTPGHGMFTSHAKSELLERIFGQNVTNAPLIDSQIDRPKSNG